MERAPKLSTMSEGMAAAENYYNWVYSGLRPHLGRRVLEIGPGYGAMARRALDDGRDYWAIDIEDAVISRLRARLRVDPDRLVTGDVLDPRQADRFAEAGVDTVLSMNVLEHIEDDAGHLRGLGRCAPGGRLVLFVPAMQVLYGSMDREAGHFRRYDPATLRKTLERAGLGVRRLSFFNALGALTWFASARVLRLPLHGEATDRWIRLHDLCAVPLARLLDPLLRGWGGQSILAVADIPA